MGKPKIRFKGYTEDWEQRKLGEVATYRRGSFPQPYGKSEWYDGDGAMPFVQVADVSDEMNLVEETKQKISILAQPMSVFAEKNSVLVTLQGSIGRVAIMQYGAFVDRTVLIFEKYKAEIDKTFWAYIIKQKFIDEARKAPGGTIKTITKEALSDFDLSIPKYQEQKQIGAYFRNLDNLITLHQRKCDETKKLKKCMLQKMFPKEGEKVPEIRFSGFTGDWKQRKLESLLDNLQNNTLSRADLSYEKGKIKNIHYGDILIKFGEILNIKKEQLPNIVNEDVVKKYKTSILQNGDIVFVDTAEDETVGKCSEIAGLTDEIVLSGLHTIPCRPKLKFADGYLGYYLNSEIFHQQLLPFMQGIKVTSISKAAMKKMNIIYPKSVEEQAKIGGYFYNLDNLITFHQQKCDELKNIKKFMLQNMFVSEK